MHPGHHSKGSKFQTSRGASFKHQGEQVSNMAEERSVQNVYAVLFLKVIAEVSLNKKCEINRHF